MNGMTFKSFDGNTLAADDYKTVFTGRDNRAFQSAVGAALVQRGHRAPQYAIQTRTERYLVLTVKVIDAVNVKTLTDSLIQIFNTTINDTKKLKVTDTDAVDWEVQAKPVSHITNAGIHKITFMLPDGVWFQSSTTTESTWNVTASGDT